MELFVAFTRDVSFFVQKELYRPAKKGNSVGGIRIQGVIATIAFCALVPPDPLQVFCIVLSSFCVWLYQRTDDSTTVVVTDKAAEFANIGDEKQVRDATPVETYSSAVCRKPRLPRPIHVLDVDFQDELPAASATLTGNDWEADTARIMSRLTPSPDCDKMVTRVVEQVKKCIEPMFQEVEVVGFASVNMTSLHCTIDAPSLDVVIRLSEATLITLVQGQSKNIALSLAKIRDEGKLDLNRLKKSAIRMCTLRLSHAGFVFSRSSFRYIDPKVTMFAALPGANPVAFDISVNALLPPYLKELTDAVYHAELRARDLMLLVTHWAKIRKLCFVPKGYLSPYSWALKVIYFLQVRTAWEGPLLPPLETVKYAAGYGVRARTKIEKKDEAAGSVRTAVGTLFSEFFAFYNKEFARESEVVSIRAGRRTRNRRHQVQFIVRDDYTTDVAPIIEDPMNPCRTVRTPTKWHSLCRTRAELARADELCASGSLTKLLEPCVEVTAAPTPAHR